MSVKAFPTFTRVSITIKYVKHMSILKNISKITNYFFNTKLNKLKNTTVENLS